MCRNSEIGEILLLHYLKRNVNLQNTVEGSEEAFYRAKLPLRAIGRAETFIHMYVMYVWAKSSTSVGE